MRQNVILPGHHKENNNAVELESLSKANQAGGGYITEDKIKRIDPPRLQEYGYQMLEEEQSVMQRLGNAQSQMNQSELVIGRVLTGISDYNENRKIEDDPRLKELDKKTQELLLEIAKDAKTLLNRQLSHSEQLATFDHLKKNIYTTKKYIEDKTEVRGENSPEVQAVKQKIKENKEQNIISIGHLHQLDELLETECRTEDDKLLCSLLWDLQSELDGKITIGLNYLKFEEEASKIQTKFRQLESIRSTPMEESIGLSAQGGIQDCSLVATLNSVAAFNELGIGNPIAEKMILNNSFKNEDGSYHYYLLQDKKWFTVTKEQIEFLRVDTNRSLRHGSDWAEGFESLTGSDITVTPRTAVFPKLFGKKGELIRSEDSISLLKAAAEDPERYIMTMEGEHEGWSHYFSAIPYKDKETGEARIRIINPHDPKAADNIFDYKISDLHSEANWNTKFYAIDYIDLKSETK